MLTVFTCQTDLFRCFVVSLFCCFVVCCCFLESSPSKHPLGCSSLTEKVEKVDKQSNNGFLVFFVFFGLSFVWLCDGCRVFVSWKVSLQNTLWDVFEREGRKIDKWFVLRYSH